MADSLPADAASRALAAVEPTLARWRADHPHATLADIERAVDQHLSDARAALIGAVAADAPDVRPSCPDCGQPLQRVGTRSRQLRTAQAGEVRFTEAVWRCPVCGTGLSPPD